MERYILEVRYVDKMQRTRKSSIQGVYRTLEEVHAAVNKTIDQPKDKGLRREYSVQINTDPAFSWV